MNRRNMLLFFQWLEEIAVKEKNPYPATGNGILDRDHQNKGFFFF